MKNIMTIIVTLVLTFFLLNCETSKTNISKILGDQLPNAGKVSSGNLVSSAIPTK